MTLAELHEAASRKAAAAESTVAKEEAVLAADLAYAHQNKGAMGDGYWQPLHRARLKAQTARALADAITEIRTETGEDNGKA
ncbi:MAG: hypothetical protein EOS70_27765 [Mesorhizobium sp.]|uniref:hypothetical protein n=1 Tax=Mesorhizobium sp. TaxID=1871066 RepID=UPI000FE8D849|nr:hypothetical protein [Mesorhizobium sp.]RWC28113.1 MAG: hypothetical protein EOS70_27765 [Mesorhizobium sp.]